MLQRRPVSEINHDLTRNNVLPIHTRDVYGRPLGALKSANGIDTVLGEPMNGHSQLFILLQHDISALSPGNPSHKRAAVSLKKENERDIPQISSQETHNGWYDDRNSVRDLITNCFHVFLSRSIIRLTCNEISYRSEFT